MPDLFSVPIMKILDLGSYSYHVDNNYLIAFIHVCISFFILNSRANRGSKLFIFNSNYSK